MPGHEVLARRGARIGPDARHLEGLARAPEDTKLLLLLASIEERQFRNLAAALRLCQSALKLEPESAEAKLCVDRNQAFLAERKQRER